MLPLLLYELLITATAQRRPVAAEALVLELLDFFLLGFLLGFLLSEAELSLVLALLLLREERRLLRRRDGFLLGSPPPPLAAPEAALQ